MTDREKAVVTAYTGVTMLAGEKFSIFHKYIEDIMGRPVWTHELADGKVWEQIKEKSKDDFLKICKTEERPQGEWIDTNEAYIVNEDGKRIPNSGISECSVCKQRVAPLFMGARNFCPNCGADMRKEEEE